jgi:hypothetical protein
MHMNIKALITTLVLGSSSVAMARPAAADTNVTASAQLHVSGAAHFGTKGPAYRPHQPAPVYHRPAYQPAPVYRPVYRPAWVSLGGVSHIADGEMSFWPNRFAREGREFSTVKLQSNGGKSLIYRVLIQFQNGRTQTVELNQYLNASNPSITIDLAGRTRQIAKVTVIGRNARQSAFQVMAI